MYYACKSEPFKQSSLVLCQLASIWDSWWKVSELSNTRVLKVLWSAGGKRTSPPSYASVSSSRRPEYEHINRGYYLLLTTQVKIKITSIFSLILQLNHGISTSGWFLISQKILVNIKSRDHLQSFSSSETLREKISTPEGMVFYTVCWQRQHKMISKRTCFIGISPTVINVEVPSLIPRSKNFFFFKEIFLWLPPISPITMTGPNTLVVLYLWQMFT